MGWFDLYLRLVDRHPGFRRYTRLFFYQGLGTLFRNPNWTFMNFGYAPLSEAERDTGLERYCASLYRHVAGAVSLSGAMVLEVGSGRGGGAAFVMSRLGPASVVGLDYAPRHVSLCRRLHRAPGLSFVAGDAEALPFPDGSFDAVLNVESSHMYASMDAFLAGVHRVLRPGGRFLFADFRYADQLAGLDAALERAGLAVLRKTDITVNVVRALREDNHRRLELIERGAPRPLHHLMREFAGVEDSRVLQDFVSGSCRYLSWVLAKPA